MNRWTSAVGFVGLIAIALACLGSLTACEKSPASPSPRPPGEISRVEIAGPRAVAPGETARFSLTAYWTNGSSRDVTDEASWSSAPGDVLSVTGPGLATGRERGDASISAVLNAGSRLNGTKDVIVVPAGTYRLAGVVRAAVASGPVADARLEVTTGAGSGLVTTTEADGRYRLYGVSGTTNIRVSKDGYEPVTRTIHVADHDAFDFDLPPRGTPDVWGTYTLTITAADECRVGLGEGHVPEEARVRRYTADVTQDPRSYPPLKVVLSGATFAVRGGLGDRFWGRVEPGRVVFFSCEDDCGYSPALVEKLTTSTFLVVGFYVVATGTADRLAGMLDYGYFEVWDHDPWDGPFEPIASCHSARHQFLLSR